MRILIEKALEHFYILKESLILCKHGNIYSVLDIKKKQNLKLFFTIHIHIVEIPTNKKVNSYKLKISKIGNYYLGFCLFEIFRKIYTNTKHFTAEI